MVPKALNGSPPHQYLCWNADDPQWKQLVFRLNVPRAMLENKMSHLLAAGATLLGI